MKTHILTHTERERERAPQLPSSLSFAAWRLSIISYLQVGKNDVLFMSVCVCVCTAICVSVRMCEYLYLYWTEQKLNCYLWFGAVYTRLVPSAIRITCLWFINNSKWKVIGGTCRMWNVFMRQMKCSQFNYVCTLVLATHTVHKWNPKWELQKSDRHLPFISW